MNDTDKVVFTDLLHKIDYYYRKPTKGRIPSRDRYIKNYRDDDVRKILNLDTKLSGRGIEKIIIPSNINDIYSRLEVLLGIKLSGQTNIFTWASNLKDELFKRIETQKKQKYRNALDKIQS